MASGSGSAVAVSIGKGALADKCGGEGSEKMRMDERGGPWQGMPIRLPVGRIQERCGVTNGCLHPGALSEGKGDEERPQRMLTR